MKQVSKHLVHVKKRMMEAEYLGHEVVRQYVIALMDFSPPPRGDWGWMLRKCQDIAVRQLRQLQKLYSKSGSEIFEERAIHIVRLYLEEALET